MSFKTWCSVSAFAFGILLLMMTSGGRAGGNVSAGMSPSEVIAMLGPPDKKAVLVGKALRELREGESENGDFRLVYIYEATKVRVWFKNGKVTGMTRDGLPAW